MIYQPDAPLTLSSAAMVLEAGLRAIASGARTIDLTAVSDTDSAAVAILLAWQRAALAQNVPLSFRHAPPALCSLAKLYGVFELLPFSAETIPETESTRH